VSMCVRVCVCMGVCELFHKDC